MTEPIRPQFCKASLCISLLGDEVEVIFGQLDCLGFGGCRRH